MKILGTINKHPSMKPRKFNNKFLYLLPSKFKTQRKAKFGRKFQFHSHKIQFLTAEFLEHLF